MEGKFRNRYRIPSSRAQWWDYARPGAYFITIVTAHRRYFFGNIANGNISLSPVGEFARQCWYEIPDHFERVSLDAFVVMPNHVHGIIIMEDGDGGNIRDESVDSNDCDPTIPADPRTIPPPEPRTGIWSFRHPGSWLDPRPYPPPQPVHPRFQNPGKNTISTIIGGYKSAVTKYAHRSGLKFGWQPRFHDCIIRDEDAFQRIRRYIETNPTRWVKDRFHVPRIDGGRSEV